ncbi:MAG: hypothetical protein ACSHYC_06420 [Alphaproteobacteria bacterium]
MTGIYRLLVPLPNSAVESVRVAGHLRGIAIRGCRRTGWRTFHTEICNHDPGFLAFAIRARSHPIGAMHHTHHGTTNAMAMHPVPMFNRPAFEERLAQAAAYLGIGSSFDEFYAYVGELNAALGISKDLTDFGIINPDLDRLTAEALKDPSVGGQE